MPLAQLRSPEARGPAARSAGSVVTVLVTGGAGYIGSHTVARLAELGRDVIALDDLSSGHREAVRDAELIVGDAGDGDLVTQVIRDHGVDSIVHFAAWKSVEASVSDPAGYFAANVSTSIALLRSAAAAGVRSVVFSSTCAVYGSPERLPVDEDAPVRPASPYGESKLLVERMLPWLDGGAGVRSVVLRYFNAAGAALDGSNGEAWDEAANLVPVVLRAAAGLAPAVQVFGTDYPTPDGTAIRDYVHVLDVADAHVRALDHLAAGGPSLVLNIGTGRGTSVREILDVARRVTERPIPSEDASRRPGDVPAVWAATDRAERTIGWRARLGIPEILESAWRWHTSHPTGHRAQASE
jgi:UDP-glucose-4-epimerase GalE